NLSAAFSKLTDAPISLRTMVRRTFRGGGGEKKKTTKQGPRQDDTIFQLMRYLFPDAQSDSQSIPYAKSPHPGSDNSHVCKFIFHSCWQIIFYRSPQFVNMLFYFITIHNHGLICFINALTCLGKTTP